MSSAGSSKKKHTFLNIETKLGNQKGSSSEVTSTSPVEDSKKESLDPSDNSNSSTTSEKPVIKVKSFAVAPEDDNSLTKPLVDKTPPTNVITPVIKINKDFASGAFLVQRSEASNVDPPLWKIDGKALLQKYYPFHQNDKTLYKNTAEYSGWSYSNKSKYFPVSVIFKQQNKKEHIVELERIKWDEPDESGQED